MVELQRLLLSPKRLIILVMIAVINLALFSGYCRTEREEQMLYYSYMGINAQAEEYRKTQRYLNEDYPAYLEYVQNQSQSQSILSKLKEQSAYVDRNLQKTAEDYSHLNGIRLEEGENRGINAVRSYSITDYLLLIAPLLLVLEMRSDTDTAVGDLTRSTRQGRVPLCAWRILCIVLMSAASVVMLYGGNILYTCKFYGNPGFFRAVQSIPEFQLCPMRLTVGGYLLAAGCLKVLALTVISLIIWVTLARFHAVLGWMISAGWIGTAFLLNRIIVPTSKINHLKFMNVFATLNADTFFSQYCNLDWFGYPSGFFGNMLIFCTLLLIVFTVLCLWLIGYAYPKKVGQSMEALKDRIAKQMTKHLPAHSLFGFEGWKLMFAQKGLLLLLLTALMGFSLWRDIHIYVPHNYQTERFYTLYSGEVTQWKIERAAFIVIGETNSIKRGQIALAKAYLNGESTYEIQRIQGNIAQDQNDLRTYKQLMDKLLALANYKRTTGRAAWFIQQGTYLTLFQDSAAERSCCMVLLLYLIFAFSGIQAYDNRYDTRMLLRSTKRGRAGILAAQTIWIMLLTLIVSIGLHGVYLIHLFTDAGFEHLEAPAQSLEIFQWIPFAISLRTVIILYMVLRYLAACAVTAGIFAVSRISKNPQKALMLAMVIFLLPSALAESGIEQLRFLDFVRFLACSIPS